MKKLVLALIVLGCFAVGSKAAVSGSATKIGDYYDVIVSSTYAVTATTSAYITVPEVQRGVQRIITNNSAGNLYISYEAGIATTQATPIYTKEHYIEDRYFGIIYLQGDNSADTRISVINW
jgi:hypothetical protein